jgi:hypothetical protein
MSPQGPNPLENHRYERQGKRRDQAQDDDAFADIDALIRTNGPRRDVGEHCPDDHWRRDQQHQTQGYDSEEQPDDLRHENQGRDRKGEVVVPRVDQRLYPLTLRASRRRRGEPMSVVDPDWQRADDSLRRPAFTNDAWIARSSSVLR